MPNRLLREGILSSERVNRLGAEAEVFYRRLMSVVDDYGRFQAHPSLLRAALYPLKLDSVDDGLMARLLAEVEAAGLVQVYEAGGKRYVLMQDFRQQVRAKGSKYPAPPAECGADAQHMPRTRAASAHLGGGGVEGVFEDGGEGGAVCGGEGEGGLPQQPPAAANAKAGKAPAENAPAERAPAERAPAERAPAERAPAENARSAAPLHVQIAVQLREQGVAITSGHPLAIGWAARGVSVAQVLEALAIARLRKPEGNIAPNYLAPIVEDIVKPPAPAAARAAPPAWWASEAATLSKGRELGLNARPGEGMGEYRARLSGAIAGQRSAAAGAAPP